MALGRQAVLLVSIFFIVKTTTWAWHNAHSPPSAHLLNKRSIPVEQLGIVDNDDTLLQCDAVQLHEDQCAFVLEHCQGVTPGMIDYIRWYYCASGAARPMILIVLCAWLLFLFGFVGIAASDFFCPNLQTIAFALHLSESLTGVTFLAFGNGSPDLFSTFSAMNSDMGSLALGELVGAAAFIVSVVAGSMCAIKPFRTKRFSFIRDVSFFTAAVLLIMAIVADGLIYLYEAIILIVFYIIYVLVVVGGNYVMKKRSNYLNLVQRARLEYEENGPEVDNLLRGNDWYGQDVQEDEMELYDEGFETEGYQTGRRGTTHPKLRIRTSLFSAIEFQDVVRSLQHANTRSSGLTRHYHRRREFDQDINQSVPLSSRNEPSRPTTPMYTSRRSRLSQYLAKMGMDPQQVMFYLFPSLENFSEKSIYSKISSMISAPVIFLLAVTLPVVKESAVQGVVLDQDALDMLQDIPDEPVEMNELAESQATWNQWMTAVQLVCAPIFVATVFAVNDVVPAAIILPVAAGFGLLITVAFKLTTSPLRQPRLYWMMAFVGFAIAMVWIFVIANEVVSVLQTIGMALGISDAILGLTVFALGNSLGDLVANVTMAKMGYPMMAMSACFGGPMLNIMLGVGIGATFVTTERNAPYPIELSTTILVSAIGLLVVLISLLVLVPLNNYRMSRIFGVGSIAVYLICTVINLVIEITGHQ